MSIVINVSSSSFRSAPIPVSAPIPSSTSSSLFTHVTQAPPEASGKIAPQPSRRERILGMQASSPLSLSGREMVHIDLKRGDESDGRVETSVDDRYRMAMNLDGEIMASDLNQTVVHQAPPVVHQAPPVPPPARAYVAPTRIPAYLIPEPTDCLMQKIVRVEKRGRCGAVAGAVGRFVYTAGSIVPNAVGGAAALLTAGYMTLRAGASCCGGMCAGTVGMCGCSEECANWGFRNEIEGCTRANNWGSGIVENLQITGVAVGTILYKVTCGVPTYLISRCCPERVEAIQHHVLRCIDPSSFNDKPAGSSCWMKAVRKMSGTDTLAYQVGQAAGFV